MKFDLPINCREDIKNIRKQFNKLKRENLSVNPFMYAALRNAEALEKAIDMRQQIEFAIDGAGRHLSEKEALTIIRGQIDVFEQDFLMEKTKTFFDSPEWQKAMNRLFSGGLIPREFTQLSKDYHKAWAAQNDK